jgi:hypothetical protein
MFEVQLELEMFSDGQSTAGGIREGTFAYRNDETAEIARY